MRFDAVIVTTVAAGFAAAVSVTALAQNNGSSKQDAVSQQDNSGSQQKIDILTWDHSGLYQGWSAETMFGVEVRGENGEAIGDVENIIVNAEGNIDKIVVEAGGFLDIGDTHFAVGWDQVSVAPGLEYVTVPINEDNVSNFSLFGDDEVPTGPRAWRVTELTDDYARLQGAPYGYVDDLIFNNDGKLQAVVIIPDITYGVGGPYAYPYYGYGYEPGLDYYDLPYNRTEIENLKPFDYSMLRERGEFAAMGEEQN